MKLAAAAMELVEYDIETNLKTILTYIGKAAQDEADLVLFPETALTGLVISDDYHLDRTFALTIDAPQIEKIANAALNRGIWVAVGFLEICAQTQTLYDSALLFDAHGKLALHQRRLSTGWCDPSANLGEYGYGDILNTADTPWGKVGFLVCGDLFHAPIHDAAKARLDLLLFPFARCFGDIKNPPQVEWDDVEWPEYSNQLRIVGAYSAGANYNAPVEGSPFDGGFGGAFFAGPDGGLICNQPLHEPGMVFVKLPL